MKIKGSFQSGRLPMTAIILFVCLCLEAPGILAKPPFIAPEQLTVPPAKVIRTCCSFGMELGISVLPVITKTDITALDRIGRHHFLGGKEEGNGIIYTHRGGFIDLGHVRDCADWTAYLYQVIHGSNGKESSVRLNLGNEAGVKTLTIQLPEILDSLQEYELAGKIAYDLSLWHEIATWFGASYVPLVSEKFSSFSPEDLYSNLLGVTIGIKALQSDLEYEEAMSQLIPELLKELSAVPTLNDTYEAMMDIEGLWWTKEAHLPSKEVLLVRYLEENPVLMPWLVPGDEGLFSLHALQKPGVALVDYYELKIVPNRRIPYAALFPARKGKYITHHDFGDLVEFIRRESIK